MLNKIKNIEEENIILNISIMKDIIVIFLGPFLTAYFVSVSTNNIIDLSLYYIFSYLFAAITTYFVSKKVKNKSKIQTFRFGVLTSFIYIISIILLRENLVDYLFFVAFLHGFSTAFYWVPFNLFLTYKIKKSKKASFMIKNQIISSVVGVVVPILLASLITITNYALTGVIILILSLIQLILSNFLKKEETTDFPKLSLKNTFQKLKKNKKVKSSLIAEFLIGMNISSGALQVLVTLLILGNFHTDMNLGLITSFTTFMTIISLYIYGKVYKNKDDRKIIIVSSVLPFIALLLLLFVRNNITLIIYNLCFAVFANILLVIRKIHLYTLAGSNIISEDIKVEFLTLREIVLNMGRVTSYLLLLIAGIIGGDLILNFVLIILTISILIAGLYIKNWKLN